MAIGRERLYDLGQEESMDVLEERQRKRVASRLVSTEWRLTIRGKQPAQIALDRAPILSHEPQKGPR
jgi:hypothetical protein